MEADRVILGAGQSEYANSQAVHAHAESNADPGGSWFIYLQMSFDQVHFVARCNSYSEAEYLALRIEGKLQQIGRKTCSVRIERIGEAKARKHNLAEQVQANCNRGRDGDKSVEAIAAWIGAQLIAQMPEVIAQPRDDEEFRPAAAFPKGMAARLRMAARKGRKTKRVASKVIDGVVCYSMTDVKRWWPDDLREGVIVRVNRRK